MLMIVSVTISTNDPHILITDSTEYYGDIAIGQSINITDGFAVEFSDSVPNNHMIIFTVKADGEDLWFSNFFMNACAPEFTFNDYTIDDASGNGNGYLDPGETAILIVYTVNSGLSTICNVENNISSIAEYISIIDSVFTIDTLQAGEQKEAQFTISADQLVPLGTSQIIHCMAFSGAYAGEDDLSVKTGVICEDWETGDFSKFNWLTTGADYWTIDNLNPFEGTFSSKSGDIGDSENHLPENYT